uniref:non-specific serine/threonine protein kinase n=1 Tax=Chromera velia CCMP2878 TaxID=1169474 RepID=A0A0G4F2J7_9ALVE|eukprot:Cvel_14661.t1-p1 / transcript=Cvel_14661.t1 / gene=Cvel_14661 / organism=Chromera_velia_CCMP2878 / gene_product=Calcium-dependent protein kinase 2, putative / transcript_product=Calcium-dependent protein kinase 2, putative / location=Cvel_scaffold1051:3342-7954(+) / protein_length=856 / sequence_SO=supercontig / SO=protein_coding / is_pseudo=false
MYYGHATYGHGHAGVYRYPTGVPQTQHAIYRAPQQQQPAVVHAHGGVTYHTQAPAVTYTRQTTHNTTIHAAAPTGVTRHVEQYVAQPTTTAQQFVHAVSKTPAPAPSSSVIQAPQVITHERQASLPSMTQTGVLLRQSPNVELGQSIYLQANSQLGTLEGVIEGFNGRPLSDCNDIFDAYDGSKSGKLDKADTPEAVNTVLDSLRLAGMIIPGMVEWLFEKFDREQKGHITKEEFPKFVRILLVDARDRLAPPAFRFNRQFFQQGRRHLPLQQKYEVQQKLGQGAFGAVFKVKCKVSGVFRCGKQIPKASAAMSPELIDMETAVLRRLDHPNIMKFYETFEDPQNLWLIMEYISGGTLLDQMLERFQRNDTYTEGEAHEIIRSLLKAVAHCHANKVMHKDLKPDNVMVPDDGLGGGGIDLKVIDFGLAEMFMGTQQSSQAAGTPYYMAPEVFNRRFDSKCDIWSIGVLLYMLLTAHFPFDAPNREEYQKVVNTNPLQFPSKLFKFVSEDGKDLISKMLSKDPTKRLTASDCLRHKWFEKQLEKSGMEGATKSSRSTTSKGARRKMLAEKKLSVLPQFETKEDLESDYSPATPFTASLAGGVSAEGEEGLAGSINKGFKKALSFAPKKGTKGSSEKGGDSEREGPSSPQHSGNELSPQTSARKSNLKKSVSMQSKSSASPKMPRLYQAFKEFASKNTFQRVLLCLVSVNIDHSIFHRAPEHFRLLDTDHDGYISLDELEASLKTNKNIPEKELKSILAAMDSDKDGRIAYTEFLAAVFDPTQPAAEPHLRSAFGLLDRDGDGNLSEQDLLVVSTSEGLNVRTGTQDANTAVKGLFKAMDLNRDGRVTFEDFLAYLRQ